MAELPALSWANLGPWGLLSIVVIAIVFGRLIPWMTWRAWQTTWNERLADAKDENQKLHTTVQNLIQTVDVYNAQLKQLLDATKDTQTLLTSLTVREVTGRAVVEAQDPNGNR